MSAFICDNYHISVLAIKIKCLNIDFSINGSTLSVEQIAEELYKTNLESVNYRYNYEDNTSANFIFDQAGYQYCSSEYYSPVEIIKAAHCYRYQSCEHPGYKNSLAKMFIELLIKRMVQCMPSYKDAEFQLEKPQKEPKYFMFGSME